MFLPPPQLEDSWKKILEEEWAKPYLTDLAQFIAKERASGVPIYPSKEEVFSAFKETPFEKVQVVIVGQDPYHGPRQAHGLSFSVKEGVTPPPSLKNIFKELQDDLGLAIPKTGCLVKWAKQGVLLLNAVLTVREGEAGSHHGKGWELFTDAVIAMLALRSDPLVFVLWGKAAQEKCKHILESAKMRHYLLTAAHPSPYSAYSGFMGCRHFSKINEFLTKQGKTPIDWTLD